MNETLHPDAAQAISEAAAHWMRVGPDLLEACKAAVAELADMVPPHVRANDMRGCQNPHIAEQLRAAIAKAEGRGE